MANRIAFFVLSASLAFTVSCGSRELPLMGKVTVDGEPMDSGTLHFEPVDGEMQKGSGGTVERGVLKMPAGHGLRPGRYRVSATAFKQTGRTINDYQRGAVEEMVQLTLGDSPQEIQLSLDTAQNLTIEFTTASNR